MSISDDDIREAIAETFRVESDEHIQAINRLLLRLEQGGVADISVVLDGIAREAHTLKGASSILGLTLVQQTAHSMEEVFEALRDARLEAPADLFDLLYSALDRLAVGCQRVEDPEGADRRVLEELQAACHRYAVAIRVGQKGSGAEALGPAEEGLEAGDWGLVTPPQPARFDVSSDSTPESPAGPRPPADPSSDVSGVSKAESPAGPRPPAPDPGSDAPASPQALAPGPGSPGPRHQASQPAEPSAGEHGGPREETIRVPIRKLDSLMAQIGELLITRIRNEDRLGVLRQLHAELEDTNRDWSKLRDARRALATASAGQARTSAVKVQDLLDRVEAHLKALTHRVTFLGQEFARDAMQMSILADNLQEDIKRARMLPVSTILDGYHRLVRDVARREDKQAVLVLRGTDTEVDKRVLELIKDPLMHLLRNAVSHGIELASERRRIGKDPTGTVTVRTHQAAGNIVIEVEDDGAGIDTERLLDRAVERGAVDATIARTLSREQVLQLVFHPGLSTKETVTDVSGRGIGMDVVRENVLRVQGQITLETTPGRGTRIVISLPVTLSTTKCLVIEASGHAYAIPIASVERILRITRDDVHEIEGERAIFVADAPVALARLSDVLGLPPAGRHEDSKFPVVVLQASNERLAVLVDALVDEQEMVIKPLGKQLVRVRNIAGGTVLGSGQVMLVLNPPDVVSASAETRLELPAAAGAAAGVLEQARPRVVLAEDSITTRMMEKSILESAGYEVVPCGDGLEALRVLQGERCDVLVTDVNMPGLDGFGLIERVRAMNAYADLPILLVSSLGSDEDRRRGMQAGANAYIVKKDFEQGRFLEVLRELV